jgi:uncharacterized membrane protein YidH (DUF202 family)
MAIIMQPSGRPDSSSPALSDARPRRNPVNLRSVLLGLIGVAFICGLTPYNNCVVSNTDLVGSMLPTGLLLYFILIVLAINAPLLRLAPRWAISPPELAVALGMTLVSCALPYAGLMRYLPGNLVGYWNWAAFDNSARELMTKLNLPNWMFPTFHSADPALRGNEHVITDYIGRAPTNSDTFAAHWKAVPWALWRTPAIAWGILIGAVFGGIMCLMVITRRQWVENERLPFPIASIYVAMIEPPDEGKAFNTLFSNRLFWIAFALVFVIDGLVGMNLYDTKHFPEIPLHFDLSSDMTSATFRNVDGMFKSQTIFFTVIGLTFFVQTRTAFSMWAFFVGLQVIRMLLPTGREITEGDGGMSTDQFFGAIIPYAIAILWVGREHFRAVFMQMFRKPRGNEPRGKYLPYWMAAWGLCICLVVMIGWLIAAGASVVGAVTITAMMMMIFMVVAKLVAETGMLYIFGLPRVMLRPWLYLANDMPASLTHHASLRTYFLSSMFSGVITYDERQRLPAYASHALRVADAVEDPESRPKRYSLFFALILALVAGYLISGAATLYTEYEYAATLDRNPQTPLNGWGVVNMPRWFVMEPAIEYIPPKTGGVVPHSRLEHFAIGAAITAGLSIMRLRYDWWPLHPVGYLLVYTLGLKCVWFSIFLGWLCKVVTLRIGGAGLFRRLREFFIGLILGEASAVAFWLVFSLIRASMGASYTSINILPG